MGGTYQGLTIFRDNEGNFDLSYISADDVSRLFMGAASAKHLGSNLLNVNALKRITPSMFCACRSAGR